MTDFIESETLFCTVIDSLICNNPNRILPSGKTLLLEAIYEKKYFIVKELLENGADPNICNQTDIYPISYALYKGYIDIFFLLIQNGASIRIVCQNGMNLLMMACKYNRREFFEFLLGFNFDLDIKCHKGNTALFYAIYSENDHMVNSLLSRKAAVNIYNKDGQSPLCIASLLQNETLITMLELFGANLNYENNEGSTALISAIKNNNMKILTLLYKKKTNFLLRNKFNVRPLEYAIICGDHEMIRFFERFHSKKDFHFIGKIPSLFYVIKAKKGNVDSIKLLASKGCDINIIYKNEDKVYTPLLFTMELDDFEAFKVIIELGGNPSFGFMRTPIQLAIDMANSGKSDYINLINNQISS